MSDQPKANASQDDTQAPVAANSHLQEIFSRIETKRKHPVEPMEDEDQITPIEKAQKPQTAYAAREMILLNLPHSDPSLPVWTRSNGKLSLLVQGGYRVNSKTNTPEYVGIPYGAKARLILFFLMSEAVTKKSRRIYLGKSFNAFLEALGTGKNRGGKDSGRQAVTRQLERILYASFMVQSNEESEDVLKLAGENARFVKKYALWFSKKDGDQLALMDSYVDLSEELYASLQKASIPLDWDILLQLKSSPLAIDLYAWLSYESARAQLTGKPRFVPWGALQKQIGAEYGRLDNFVSAVKRELAKIEKIYPGLSLGRRPAGIEIKADSLPSVARPALEE